MIVVGRKKIGRVAAAASLLLALGAASVAGSPPAPAQAPAATDCVPASGDFARRFLLTGEVAAADAVTITTPAAPVWPMTLRFLVDDGQLVEAGEKVAEFDPSQLLSQIDTLETKVKTASNDLAASSSRASSEIANLELERAQKLAARDRAVVEARLPAELVPAREQAEKKLALERAELELKDAEHKLAGTREAQKSAVALGRLELERAESELAELRETLKKMVLVSPVRGVFVAGEHPREARMVMAGDALWPGFNLGRIPRSGGFQVEARLFDVDDGKIAIGQEVRAVLDSEPGRELHGKIRQIDEVAQEISRSSPRRAFAVIVDIAEFAAGDPSGLASRLRPGMSVRVEALEPPRRTLILPRHCLAAWPAEEILACGTQACEVKAAGAGR